jgi:hypothetical protein
MASAAACWVEASCYCDAYVGAVPVPGTA